MTLTTAKTIKLFNRWISNKTPVPEYPRNVVDEYLEEKSYIVLSDSAKDIFCDWIYTGNSDLLYEAAISYSYLNSGSAWYCRKLLQELLVYKYGCDKAASESIICAKLSDRMREYYPDITTITIGRCFKDMLRRLMKEDQIMVIRQVSGEELK